MKLWLFVCCLMLACVCQAAHRPVKVEIKGTPGHYQLFRDGKPYLVRGVGGRAYKLGLLKSIGGNSIRTWSVGDGRILDAAEAHGLTVALCLDVGRQRLGFDYSDKAAVARQLERFRQQVLKYRNHPALLVWIIGNELNYGSTNPRVWNAVNDISKMIHRLDPNHPTTTALAGIGADNYEAIRERAPDLDFLSVQLYGGLHWLPSQVKKIGVRMPIMVTEWGTIGHWETPKTSWGAPIEINSSEKALRYLNGYEQVIKPMAGEVIGSYAFLWGHKLERTPTWYGMFAPDGSVTQVIDDLAYAWTGHWPAHRSPVLDGLTLDGQHAADNVTLVAGKVYTALVRASDPDGDKLAYRWQVREESGSRKVGGDEEKMPARLPGLVKPTAAAKVRLTAPAKPGPYRLYVYVRDSRGATAYANVPFLVK